MLKKIAESIDLQNLQSANQRHNDAWVAKGGDLTSYTCAHCGEEVRIRCPGTTDVGVKGFWDSCRQCVHCGKLAFVRVWPTGRTDVVKIN